MERSRTGGQTRVKRPIYEKDNIGVRTNRMLVNKKSLQWKSVIIRSLKLANQAKLTTLKVGNSTCLQTINDLGLAQVYVLQSHDPLTVLWAIKEFFFSISPNYPLVLWRLWEGTCARRYIVANMMLSLSDLPTLQRGADAQSVGGSLDERH